MQLKEVLALLPGITKADIQYWESRGHIEPERVAKKRIERRDYGPTFPKIQLMWEFYQQGLSPEKASRHADKVLIERSKLSLPLFFKSIKSPKGKVNIGEASLVELGVLNAPHRDKVTQMMLFASESNNLSRAAREIGPYLMRLSFVIVGDELGALLMGACCIALNKLQPGRSPLLLQKKDLGTILTKEMIAEDSRGALILGFLESLEDVENVIAELLLRKAVLQSILSLASNLKESEIKHLEQQNIKVISLFNRDEVQRLVDETES